MSLDGRSRHEAILLLRTVAAKAELLAMQLEDGKTWSGDYQRSVTEIRATMNELPEDR